jgi:hypothetical protein
LTTESIDNLAKHFYEKMKIELNLLNQDINLEEKYINKSESDQELLDLSNIINE